MKLRSLLSHTIVTSTVFCFSPYVQAALTHIGNADTHSIALPDGLVGHVPAGQGYNFDFPNVTFTISDPNVGSGNVIGNTGGISIDDSGGVGNTTLNFQANGQATGKVGETNPITTIHLLGGALSEVIFSNTVKAGTLTINAGQAKFSDNVTANVTFLGAGTANILTNGTSLNGNVDGAGKLIFQDGGTVTGTIGANTALNQIVVNSLEGAGPFTLELQGATVKAGTILINNDGTIGSGTLKLSGAALDLTGNMTTNHSNFSVLQITSNAVDMTGNIGAADQLFGKVLLGGDLTLNGDILVDPLLDIPNGRVGLQFTADKALTLSANHSVSGVITTALASTGALISNGSNINHSIGQPTVPIKILIINTGTTQVDAGIAAINTSIHRGATLAFSAPHTVVSNVNAGGTLSLGNNATPLTIIGKLNLPSFSTLAVDMSNTTTTGSITTTAATTMSPDSSIFVTNPGAATGTITNILITDGGGGGGLQVVPVTSTSLLSTFITQVDGNKLLLIMTSRSSLTDLANQSNTQGVATALGSIQSSGIPTTGSLTDVINALTSAPDAEVLNQELATLAPIVDNAVLYQTFTTQSETFGTIEERFSEIRQAQQQASRVSGYTAGDSRSKLSSWAKLFGQYADQKVQDDIAGYRANLWGVAGGIDKTFCENNLIGLAFSWSNLDLHHHVAPDSETRANSYQGALYGNFHFREAPIYFDWLCKPSFFSAKLN